MTSIMPAEEFWQGVEQFNQQEFYACHDTLEALWMEASEPDKRFYQGILQIAVGCYHLTNQNWRGAAILLGEGISRLLKYQPTYENIDVTELVRQSNDLLIALQQAGEQKIASIIQQLEETAQSDDKQGYRFPKITLASENETYIDA